MKNEITYKIEDTNSGVFATVNLPEGTFNLRLTSFTGLNNRREWKVNGHYPMDKYMITYEGGGRLFIFVKGGEWNEGETVTHRAFGKGVITAVYESSLTVEFENFGTKSIMKSIAINFLTK